MARISQENKVINYMREYGSITQLDALREFGCMRLASRISSLRKRGYAITSTLETSKNRYGETIKYSRYRMEAEQ